MSSTSSRSDTEPEPQTEGFDNILKIVGGHGRYQIILLLTVSIQMMILTFHHLGFVFIGAVPEYWCQNDLLEDAGWSQEQIRNLTTPWIPGDNGEIDWNGCEKYNYNYSYILQVAPTFEEAYLYVNMNMTEEKITEKCYQWKFDKSIYEETAVTKFNLVCDKRPLVASMQAIYMGGVLFGSLFFSTLSDKFLGRRKVTLISIVIVFISGIASAFSPSYILLIIARFFLGAGTSGSFQNCYVLLLEYSGPKYRAFIGIIEQLPFAIGYMLIPLYAYFLRNWSDLQLAFTLSGIVLFSYIWILPESSRWLASHGRIKEAVKIIEKVARINGKPEISREFLIEKLTECIDTERKLEVQEGKSDKITLTSGVKKGVNNFWSLVKTPKLRARSLVLWALYFSVTLVYYGLSFGSVRLSSNPFILVFLNGLMDVPGYSILAPIVTRLGRKPIIISGFGVSACVLIALSFTPTDLNGVRIALALTGKLWIASAFAVIYLLGAELYPTSLRTTGLGAAVIFGRFGSIAAPFFVDIRSSEGANINLPILLFGTISSIACLIAFLLPETKEKELPDKIEDVERKIKKPVNFTISSSEIILTPNNHNKS